MKRRGMASQQNNARSPMQAIILARVSSKDQEEGLSIPSQIRRLTEYAQRKGLKVEHTFQITESSLKERRTMFESMLNVIKKSREPFALIIDTIDRLQRSCRETPMLDDLRKQGKLELHFLREGLIINQHANSAQLTQWDMGVVMASSYVRQLSDNVKRSKEHSLKSGEWTSKAPFGYRNVTLTSHQKTIEIDPQYAPYVVKMFEMYASGNHSFQTIATALNDMGLKNARGNPILPSRIEATLQNTFYHGIMCIKGEYYQHKYPPLIPAWLFKKVQDMRKGHNKAPAQYAGKPILLRGLITCQQCGCTVTGDVKKQKYTYYSCSNARRICAKKWVREEQLVELLLQHFDRISLTDAQVAALIAHLKNSLSKNMTFSLHHHEMLIKELNQIQTRLSKLIDMHVDGSIDTEAYALKREEYKKRQQEINAELENYTINNDGDYIITAQVILDLARRAKEIFLSSNLNEKQQMLKFFYSNLQLSGENLLLELHEPFFSMSKTDDQTVWLEKLGTLRTFHWKQIQQNLQLLPAHLLEVHTSP